MYVCMYVCMCVYIYIYIYIPEGSRGRFIKRGGLAFNVAFPRATGMVGSLKLLERRLVGRAALRKCTISYNKLLYHIILHHMIIVY